MNRINRFLASRGSRKLLIPFFTSGYPDKETALRLIRTAIDAGADMIEIGMPFSDPMADGPDIQFSSHLALQHGTTMYDTVRLVESTRRHSDTPLILMGYFNPIIANGVARFVQRAVGAGVDGLIIPDLPFDESGELLRPATRHGLSLIHLVAPTSSRERIRKIDRSCTDFVYAVTVTGVTGGRAGYDRTTDAYLKSLRSRLTRPFVAGFGVSSPESALRLTRQADGVVIGSALIKAFRRTNNNQAGIASVGRLLGRIRRALG